MTDKTELEVTREDREAAADAVKAYRDSKNNDWQGRIRRGECDDGEMVQAFARHRLATRAPDPTPVAWMYQGPECGCRVKTSRQSMTYMRAETETPLYAHPHAVHADGLVEALEWYADQMCEGLCEGKDPKACAAIGADNCAGCPAVVALAAHRGEA